MKKLRLIVALLGLLFFEGAMAIEYETTFSGEVTECYRYSTWTGLCNGDVCKYPSCELAADEVEKQIMLDLYKYDCVQVTPYDFIYKTRMDGEIRICLTTQASATFRCHADW